MGLEALKKVCRFIMDPRVSFAMLSYLSEQAAMYGLVIIIPFYFEEQRPGEGTFWTSFFFTAGYAGMIIGDIVMAYCCKRFQPSTVLLVVVLGGMLAYAGQGFVPDPQWICILRGVSAFLTTGVPTNVYVMTAFKNEEVVEFFNLIPGLSYVAEMAVPGIITPAYIVPDIGWRYCVVFLAALALPAIAIWIVVRRQMRREYLGWLQKNKKQMQLKTSSHGCSLNGLDKAVQLGYLRCLAGRIIFIFFKHFNSIVPPLHMAVHLNMSITTIGLIVTARGFFNAVVALARIHPIIIGLTGTKRAGMLALAGLAASLAVGAIPQVLDSYLFVIGLPFVNFFAMLYFLSMQSTMHEIAERLPSSASIMIGVNEMTAGLAVLSSAPLAGVVAGNIPAFSVTNWGFCALVCALLLYTICVDCAPKRAKDATRGVGEIRGGGGGKGGGGELNGLEGGGAEGGSSLHA